MNCYVCDTPGAIPTYCRCQNKNAHPHCLVDCNAIRCPDCKAQFHGAFAVEIGRLFLKSGTVHPALVHTMIADVLSSDKKYQEAINEYKSALATPHKLAPVIMSRLATTYALSGDFNTALSFVEDAHCLLPNNKFIHDRMCFIYSFSGSPHLALKIHDKFPADSIERQLNLALTYKKLHQYDEARKLYLKVIREQELKYGVDHPFTTKTKKAFYWMVVYHEENYDETIIAELQDLLKLARQSDIIQIKRMIANATFTIGDKTNGVRLMKELVPNTITTTTECASAVDLGILLKQMGEPYHLVVRKAEEWAIKNDSKLYQQCRKLMMWDGDLQEAEASLIHDPSWLSMIYYATLLKERGERMFKKGMALCPEPKSHPQRVRMQNVYNKITL